jgi:hypothetical protein
VESEKQGQIEDRKIKIERKNYKGLNPGVVRQCPVNSAFFCGLPNYKGPAHEAGHIPHKEDVGTAIDVRLTEEQFYLLDPRGCASVN